MLLTATGSGISWRKLNNNSNTPALEKETVAKRELHIWRYYLSKYIKSIDLIDNANIAFVFLCQNLFENIF